MNAPPGRQRGPEKPPRPFAGPSSFQQMARAAGNAQSDASQGYALMEHGKLESSSMQMDEVLNMGQSALDELVAQRQMLKSTQRRLLDIANSLGLSQSAMRFIERRSKTDMYIFYGGMLATVAVIILLILFCL